MTLQEKDAMVDRAAGALQSETAQEAFRRAATAIGCDCGFEWREGKYAQIADDKVCVKVSELP